jgi:hypothetical protein
MGQEPLSNKTRKKARKRWRKEVLFHFSYHIFIVQGDSLCQFPIIALPCILVRSPPPSPPNKPLPILLKAILGGSIILLYPPVPIPEIVSTGLIVPFTYMCRKYLHYIHPPAFFPHILTPPTGTNHPPRQELFHPSVLQFCKRKTMTFLLV